LRVDCANHINEVIYEQTRGRNPVSIALNGSASPPDIAVREKKYG
jgi:hypothetical protein